MIQRAYPLLFSIVSLWALVGCTEESVDTSSSGGSSSGGSSAQAGKSGSAGSGNLAGSGGSSSGISGQSGASQAGAGGGSQGGENAGGNDSQGGQGGGEAGGTDQAGGSGQAGGEQGGAGESSGGSGQAGSSGQTGSAGQQGAAGQGSGGPTISTEAVELCGLVNAYRKENGLPEIPLSTALMTVAAYHVEDLQKHPEASQGSCNLHSWSDNPPLWGGCCYTPDHAQAQCMWDKPKQITASWGANKYNANGYEDAAAGVSSPAGALSQWKNSPAHNEVILNQGIWASKSPWPALGCGMSGGYAVLWFGDAKDPQPFQP